MNNTDNWLDCLFVGGESDGHYMPFRYRPTIKIPIRQELTMAAVEGEEAREPVMNIDEYKVAALSIDKKQAIYTLSGTLDELIQPAKLLKGINL